MIVASNLVSMNKLNFKYVNGKLKKYIEGQNVYKSTVQ